MADVVVHKRQAVIDRLKRRMEGYRRHNQDCVPRYSNAFVEQQNVQETLMLKQKYMETKTKRNVKKNDKKPMENGNVMPPKRGTNERRTCAESDVYIIVTIKIYSDIPRD